MLRIELTKKVKADISAAAISRAARVFSKQLKIKKNLTVSLAVVGDAAIKKLNRIYRRQNRVTDVLSFEAKPDFVLPADARGYLGEIVISWPQAVRQAKERAEKTSGEFLFLLVHGLLHLLGYDHAKSRKESAKMQKIHRRIMLELGFKGDLGYT